MQVIIQHGLMTYARAQLIDTLNAGTYHCISRCVRRAFLCGRDAFSGRDLSHRKDWIEQRLKALSDCFAVSVLSYAIMSNHFHLVIHVNPRAADIWSDREVALRWLRAFPGALRACHSIQQTETAVEALLTDEPRMKEIRQRLGNLSWFMRALNEPIARRANKEDNCTGRFWEGRFKCQALLDQRAILACMTYVDLNPFRALGQIDLQTSAHASLKIRLANLQRQPADGGSQKKHTTPLDSVAGMSNLSIVSASEREYLNLVFWTALKAYNLRHINETKQVAITVPKLLHAHDMSDLAWVVQVKGTERLFYRAIGSLLSMQKKALELKQSWLKGIGTCRMLASLDTS